LDHHHPIEMSDYGEEDYDYSTNEDQTPYEYENSFEGNTPYDEQEFEYLENEKIEKKKDRNLELKYVIKSLEKLKNELLEDVKTVQDSIELTKEETQLLLDFYNWNSEKLLNDFFDNGKKKILEKAGILIQEHNENQDSEFTCESCFEDFENFKKTTAAPCGHRFCDECWKTYVSIKTEDSAKYKCMAFKCPTILSEEFVLK
jgi:ariadne-1